MLINKEFIQLDVDYKTKEEIILNVAQLFWENGKLNDRESYIQAVLDRENEVSTNLGDGIGLPHARTDAVKEAGLAFIRLKEPIEWGTDSPVKIVFQIAVGEDSGNLHLEILSKLARHLIYDDFKGKLFNAKDSDELLEIISEATGGLNS